MIPLSIIFVRERKNRRRLFFWVVLKSREKSVFDGFPISHAMLTTTGSTFTPYSELPFPYQHRIISLQSWVELSVGNFPKKLTKLATSCVKKSDSNSFRVNSGFPCVESSADVSFLAVSFINRTVCNWVERLRERRQHFLHSHLCQKNYQWMNHTQKLY